MSTRSIYRSLLRLQRQWPSEPNRPGRNLKELMRSRIQTEFKQDNSGNPVHALRQLKALRTLQSDGAVLEVCLIYAPYI